MNNNEEKKESWDETEKRLRMERAKERYLEQHPFHKERKEINPINVIIELSKEYFEDNPEATEYKMEKALLGSRLDKKATATEFLCKKLEAELDFITNTKLGYLVIERKSFEDWLTLIEESKSQEQRAKSINEEYPVLAKQLEEMEARLKNAEVKMAEMRGRKEKLENLYNEKTKELENLPVVIKDFGDKIKALRTEIDKKLQEKTDLSNNLTKATEELNTITAENLKRLVEFQEKQEMVKDNKNKPIEQMLIEKNAKLEKELAKKSEESENYYNRLSAEHYTRNRIILVIFLILMGFNAIQILSWLFQRI